MNQQRFLVLGASGVVGRALRRRLHSDQAVFTYQSRPFEGANHFDVTTMRLAETIVPRYPALTHAFLLLGVTNIDSCARDPIATQNLNVVAICRAIDDLVAANIVPVFTSTDAVFDGSRGNWSEMDATNPMLTYSKQKVEVEEHLSRIARPWLVVRLSKVVDPDAPESDWLHGWLQSLKRGETIRVAHDQVFSPVDADDVADGLVRLAQLGAAGLYHMGGPESCSRLELMERLVQLVRDQLGKRPRIIPCSIRDFPFAEPRPLNTSLSSAKLYSTLNQEFSGLDAICQRIVRREAGL